MGKASKNRMDARVRRIGQVGVIYFIFLATLSAGNELFFVGQSDDLLLLTSLVDKNFSLLLKKSFCFLTQTKLNHQQYYSAKK